MKKIVFCLSLMSILMIQMSEVYAITLKMEQDKTAPFYISLNMGDACSDKRCNRGGVEFKLGQRGRLEDYFGLDAEMFGKFKYITWREFSDKNRKFKATFEPELSSRSVLIFNKGGKVRVENWNGKVSVQELSA